MILRNVKRAFVFVELKFFRVSFGNIKVSYCLNIFSNLKIIFNRRNYLSIRRNIFPAFFRFKIRESYHTRDLYN